jgi:5-methylthioadenosine/S-adenosylhomocysteine deaminase
MIMDDILIKDALIVTCDPAHTIIENGLMTVCDGKITRLESTDSVSAGSFQAKKTISANGNIVMPGLINMHCHAADSLFRGLVENLPLEEWLGRVWIAEKAILTPETTYLGSVLGLAENLLSGATTVMDMFWYPEETANAAKKLGMRISTGGIFFDLPGIGGRSHEDYVSEAHQFSQNYQADENVIPAILPHGSYTVSPEHLIDAKRIADDYEILFCTHAAETKAEQNDIKTRYNNSVIRHLNEHKLLGENVVLAHCVHLDEKEISILAKSKTNVVLNPMSNLKLGSGIAPVKEMKKAGINLTIGTDGAISGNDLDMWLAMRLTCGLAKGLNMEADAITAEQVLHMATINGAKALGKSESIGSLEIGKCADIIIVDVNNSHSIPLFDPITHLVFGAGRSDIKDVFVSGKHIVKNKKITGIDIEKIYDEVRELAPQIKASLE